MKGFYGSMDWRGDGDCNRKMRSTVESIWDGGVGVATFSVGPYLC